MAPAEEILSRLELFGIKLGLDRTRALLAPLGDPHVGLPVVLVAGSNGKGSTAALLASIVGAASYRVGLYTSPHLEDVRERIRVDGRSIPPHELSRLLEATLVAGEEVDGELPTYFEALTLAAFSWFRERRVDLAVLEVGLGGRLDATNVAEPRLSLITSISYDHQKVLGESLTEIAGEKAGILRSGVEALHWVEADEARTALERHALELGTPLRDARSATRFPGDGRAPAGSVVVTTDETTYRCRLPLDGAVQRRNLGLAVAAAERLALGGFGAVDAAAIERGVDLCRWPGRLETIELPGDRRLILDAAHNVESMELLSTHLSDGWEPGDRYLLLFGALEDKAVEEMLRTISRGASKVVLTSPQSARAQEPGSVAGVVEGETLVEPDVRAALDLALASDEPTIVACGSIYLIGEVRRELRRRFGTPVAAADVVTSPSSPDTSQKDR